MQLTQKIRVFPTEEQEKVLWKLSEKCRLVYNFALQERIDAWKNGIKGVNYFKQQNDLPKLKEKYPEYKWVYSKVLQYTLRTLDADYKSFFSLWKKGHKDASSPKYKGGKYFTTMVYNQSGFVCKDNKISFSHKYNDVGLEFKIPKKFCFDKIYQTSVFQKDGKYFVSIVYEKPEKEYVDNKLYQAFDLGITKHTAVNSNGKFIEFKNQRPDKYWLPKIQKLQSRLDHCKKGSGKWKKLNKNLKRMKRKCTNQLKDFQHKLSRKIVNNTKANTIIVGDLQVKDMCQINKYEKGIHRSLHNTGHISRFVSYLTYKSELIGKRVISINERGTIKTCCICGKQKDMPLYMRNYLCDCGNNIDRDKNSSVNIMCRFLSNNAQVDGLSSFEDNLRQTGIPIGMCSQEAPCHL